jgi:hypothetical protein
MLTAMPPSLTRPQNLCTDHHILCAPVPKTPDPKVGVTEQLLAFGGAGRATGGAEMTDYLPEVYQQFERRFPAIKGAFDSWAPPSTRPDR